MTGYMYEHIPDYDISDKKRMYKDYCRYFLARTRRMFKYTGLPATIPERDLELQLQMHGHVAVFQNDGNLYALHGSPSGEPSIYYHPTQILISNPKIPESKLLTIDKDCVLMRSDTMYQGLMPMIGKASKQLVENDISLAMADINSRMVSLISATDDNTIASVNDYLKSIVAGKLAVVADDAFFEGLKTSPLATNSTPIRDLIEYHQYIISKFWSDIGLDSNFNMKREALNSAETEQNEDVLHPFVDDMLSVRQEGVNAINDMFGLSITVEFDSTWKDNEDDKAGGGDPNETD